MVAKYAIRIILVLVIGCITETSSQSIYLEFDHSSDEKCYTSSTPNEKELYSKFSKKEKGDIQFFRICMEEFTYIKGDYCDVKKRNNVKFSSIADLYAYEDKVLAKKAKNDGVIHIIFRSEIDSIFIAERIDDESVKVYKVSWVHKIE